MASGAWALKFKIKECALPTNSREEPLARAALDFDRFFALSIDMLCIAGFDGYFKYINAAWEKTLGWTVQEMTAQPWTSFVHPDDLARTIAEADRQTRQGLTTISFENRYLARDGSYHWLLWNSRPSAEHGEMYATARDVTEQKRTELALLTLNDSLVRQVAERDAVAEDSAQDIECVEREVHSSEEQLRIFVENTPTAVAMLDREMRYLVASRRWSEDYLLGSDSIVGRRHYDIFPGVDQRWRDIHKRCLQGATEKSEEDSFPMPDGTLEWVRWEIHAWRTADGDIGGIIMLFEMIKERRRAAQEQRDTTADLLRTNSELEAFTYSVSHDLKEPLRTLQAFSQFLLKDYADKLDDEGKDYLTRLALASSRMKRLIDDLLTISHVGRQTEAIEPVPVVRIIADVVEAMRVTVQERGATVDVAPDLPKILADPGRIEQIFGNLIANGIKFNRSDAPRVEITASMNAAGEAVFRVLDNGIGIDPQYREKVFAVFQRLHRREEFDGTGAGLTIVKRAVEALGGSIWIESGPGGGSAFMFTLPVPPAPTDVTLIRDAA